jgi:hypothetical protein
MQQTGPGRSLKGLCAMSKEDKQYGGWKREGNPSSKAAEIAAPHQPNGKSNLAVGRTRQKLAQRDEIGEGGLVDSATPDHEFLSEIADVSDRTAKAADAEFRESEQHLPRRAGSIDFLNSLCSHSYRSSRAFGLGVLEERHENLNPFRLPESRRACNGKLAL